MLPSTLMIANILNHTERLAVHVLYNFSFTDVEIHDLQKCFSILCMHKGSVSKDIKILDQTTLTSFASTLIDKSSTLLVPKA